MSTPMERNERDGEDGYLKTQAARQQHAERFEAVMRAASIYTAMSASWTYSEADIDKALAAYLDAVARLGDEAPDER